MVTASRPDDRNTSDSPQASAAIPPKPVSASRVTAWEGRIAAPEQGAYIWGVRPRIASRLAVPSPAESRGGGRRREAAQGPGASAPAGATPVPYPRIG